MSRVVRFGLVGLALSAVGVVAMPSPPSTIQPADGTSPADGTAPAHGTAEAERTKPSASPAAPAASPAASVAVAALSDTDTDATPSPPAENGIRQDDMRMAALYRLVDETCDVMPERIAAGPDALTIDLPLAGTDHHCLDEVALMFDREHPGAPQLLFDVLAAKEEQDFPVLHISAMHTGGLPYLHLKSGETLFIGAVVDGWELASIDERGAAFTYGDRSFTLSAAADEDEDQP